MPLFTSLPAALCSCATLFRETRLLVDQIPMHTLVISANASCMVLVVYVRGYAASLPPPSPSPRTGSGCMPCRRCTLSTGASLAMSSCTRFWPTTSSFFNQAPSCRTHVLQAGRRALACTVAHRILCWSTHGSCAALIWFSLIAPSACFCACVHTISCEMKQFSLLAPSP